MDKLGKIKLLLLASALPLAACETMEEPAVIAVTGTTIGFDASQNSGTGSPQVTLGYKRAEVAIVSEQKLAAGEDREDIANVVMELRYANDAANGSIYQRLAVGKSAVSGAGAAVLFAREPDGTLNPDVARAVGSAIQAGLSNEGWSLDEDAEDSGVGDAIDSSNQ